MVSGSILVISAITVSILLLITIVFAVTVYSSPDSTATKKVSLSCHDRILGYARIGAYADATTVKAAMASCSGTSGI